jgi:histidinol-phosphatase (PHP family)
VRIIVDGHIHIENGKYSLNWIKEFVEVAISRDIHEIWLLEHCYRFKEFVPMYNSVCENSEFINSWFHRKAGVLVLDDYLQMIEEVRNTQFPVNINFGLEVCYFKEFEDFVYKQTKDKELDFLVGSIHFVDNFAFDHRVELWENVDIDKVYHRYFKTSIALAQCGIYNGIAHPDSIKLFGHKPTFSLEYYYNNLARELARKDMYAEQSSGIHRRCNAELGMNNLLLKAMKKQGVKIVTVSDAHIPEDVGLYIEELNDIIQNN